MFYSLPIVKIPNFKQSLQIIANHDHEQFSNWLYFPSIEILATMIVCEINPTVTHKSDLKSDLEDYLS